MKEREARKQAKADPTLRHAGAALKSVDKALAAAENANLRQALLEVQAWLSSCLGDDGKILVPTRTRRSAGEIEEAGALLAYSNPGHRGGQGAPSLGGDGC